MPAPRQQQETVSITPPLAQIVAEHHLISEQLHFYINKANYYLEVRFDTLKLKRYPVVFGNNPIDDKLQQGDRCTPEGKFSVRGHYDHAKWGYFIWIDYPTPQSWEKHYAAKARGEIAQDAAIGGEIGIHGVPEGYDYAIDERMNWTLGCISLKNADIEELIPLVKDGMSVIIE